MAILRHRACRKALGDTDNAITPWFAKEQHQTQDDKPLTPNLNAGSRDTKRIQENHEATDPLNSCLPAYLCMPSASTNVDVEYTPIYDNSSLMEGSWLL